MQEEHAGLEDDWLSVLRFNEARWEKGGEVCSYMPASDGSEQDGKGIHGAGWVGSHLQGLCISARVQPIRWADINWEKLPLPLHRVPGMHLLSQRRPVSWTRFFFFFFLKRTSNKTLKNEEIKLWGAEMSEINCINQMTDGRAPAFLAVKRLATNRFLESTMFMHRKTS